MYKVIGNGLIGKAFKNVSFKSLDCIVYASGVSNSSCTDIKQFDREASLLKYELDRAPSNIKFIYFGSCSIYDTELSSTPYVLHKKNMEELVTNFPNSLVCRLPQIAGPGSPSNSILSSIRRAAITGNTFEIWTKARRNILDIYDTRNIVLRLLSMNNPKIKIVNIANIKSYSVKEIVRGFEKVLSKEIITKEVEKGSSYTIDVTYIKDILKDLKIDFSNYLEKVIQAHYST